jgi:hypothetical protein
MNNITPLPIPVNTYFQQHTNYGSITQPGAESQLWRLNIQSGSKAKYRWAQLDDYSRLSRNKFLWTPPVTLKLEARVSASDLPGTWGFGFWNDPFNISLGLAGTARRLPALPNTAWFFYASPPNYLSLQDALPAQGMLAATFRSPSIPIPIMALALPLIPLLKWPWMSRKLRSLATHFIQQSAALLTIDCTQWHHYSLSWQSNQVMLSVDEEEFLDTPISPRGPLGLVLWIDNQYAAFTPQGKVDFGTLPNPDPAWLDLSNIIIENQ